MNNKKTKVDLFEDCHEFALAPETESTSSGSGTPRLKNINRHQVEFRVESIDQLIPDDHKARLVWDFVNQLNLSEFLKDVKSVAGSAGRPAIDPRVIVAIWLYGTVEGIASARQLGDYCREHHAFIWLRGGVEIGRKTLSNFRAEQGGLLNDLLVQSVGIMLHNKVISLEEIGQDGMRVRANAGSSSFRTLKTLKEHLKAANEYVNELQKEERESPGKARTRNKEGKIRRARSKQERISSAVNELKSHKKDLKASRQKQRKKILSQKKKNELRASTTDPEARKMKMGDGGYRPAFNVQFATTVKGQAIVAVDVTNKGSDLHQLQGMFKTVVETYETTPKSWLADAGYNTGEQIETLENHGCKTYIPVKSSKTKDPYAPKKGESEALAARRARMGTEAGKKKYKLRPQTAEFPNAEARNRGMKQFLIRGIEKALNVGLIFAITHNFLRLNNLIGSTT